MIFMTFGLFSRYFKSAFYLGSEAWGSVSAFFFFSPRSVTIRHISGLDKVVVVFGCCCFKSVRFTHTSDICGIILHKFTEPSMEQPCCCSYVTHQHGDRRKIVYQSGTCFGYLGD